MPWLRNSVKQTVDFCSNTLNLGQRDCQRLAALCPRTVRGCPTAGARHGWPRRSSRDRREPVPGKRKYNRGRTLCGNDPVAAAAVGGAVAGVAVGGGVAVCGGAAVVPHRNYDRRILGSWAFRMLQRSTGELRLIHVPRRNEATLMPIILRHVAPGTQVYSDEWAAYRNIKRAGQNYLYDHRTVNSLNRQV